MFPIPLIDAAAKKRGLQYVIIGGHAINVYAAPRATLDVDFLVKKEDRERWCEFLNEEGFKLFHDGTSFLQFNPPYGISFRLNLMLVNLQTFQKMQSAARSQRVLGVDALVPAPEHLIALKLHALKFGHAERHDKDFADVVSLTKSLGFDPLSASWIYMNECSNGSNSPAKIDCSFELPVEPGYREQPPAGTMEDGIRLSLAALELVKDRPELFAQRDAYRVDVEFVM